MRLRSLLAFSAVALCSFIAVPLFAQEEKPAKANDKDKASEEKKAEEKKAPAGAEKAKKEEGAAKKAAEKPAEKAAAPAVSFRYAVPGDFLASAEVGGSQGIIDAFYASAMGLFLKDKDIQPIYKKVEDRYTKRSKELEAMAPKISVRDFIKQHQGYMSREMFPTTSPPHHFVSVK
ncbi:MAG: hypothetical protein AAF517_11050, partial [Planctomycetota bacterium]